MAEEIPGVNSPARQRRRAKISLEQELIRQRRRAKISLEQELISQLRDKISPEKQESLKSYSKHLAYVTDLLNLDKVLNPDDLFLLTDRQDYKDTFIRIVKLANSDKDEILGDKVFSRVLEIVRDAYPGNKLIQEVNNEIIADYERQRIKQQKELRQLNKQKELRQLNQQKESQQLNKQTELRQLNQQKESQQLNQQKELRQLNQQAIVTRGDRKKNLDSLLRDKNILRETKDFRPAGKKQFGMSAGYIAKEKKTDNAFILKQFFKDPKDCGPRRIRREDPADDYENRRDGIQEYLASGLYQLLLYDRAPKEELVLADDKKSLYVRSKFFQEVTSLDKFSGATDTDFNAHNDQVKKIEGFEKVIAACTILGELDYHAGNLMVQTQPPENGRDKYIVTKIDHGRSLMVFSKDLPALTARLYKDFKVLGYMPGERVSNLKFDIAKYSDSMKQMISQLDEKQIDAVIDQKIAELKKSGFNPKYVVTSNDLIGRDKVESVSFSNFEEMAKYYKRIIKTNLDNMKEINKDLEIIAKFSNVSKKFKEGGWLKAFAESDIKNPIIFAAVNNIEIEGQNPLEWAYDNKYQVTLDVRNKQQKVNIKELSWEKDRKGSWHEVEKTVTKFIPGEKYQIDPVEYILSKHEAGQLPEVPKSADKFLSEAVYRNLTTAKGDSYKKLAERYSYQVKSAPIYREPAKHHYEKLDKPEIKKAMNEFKDAVNLKKTTVVRGKIVQAVKKMFNNVRGR